MTRRSKLLITAAILAGLGGAAVPTLAAQTGASTGAAVQTAFGGPDDGPGHHHPHGFGPDGPGFGPPEGRGPAALLEKFDTNKDGKITKAQIDTVLAAQLKKYDTDGDGTLSLSEYQALFDDQMHDAMVRSFQALNRSGDGKVTADELRAPIDHLVQRLDRNHTGVIGLNQLDGPRVGPDGDRDGPQPPPPPAGQQNGG